MDIALSFVNECYRLYRSAYRATKRLAFPSLSKPLSHSVKPMPLVQAKPWMCSLAIKQLETLVLPGSRILEWGSGGSTVFFAEGGANVTCIEHDQSWASLVATELEKRRISKNVEINHIELSPRYVNLVDELDGDFDLIVVDGRKRVECVNKALGFLRPGGWLVLDDSNRFRYMSAGKNLRGWGRITFEGPKPHKASFTQTTMWQKPT